MLNDTAIPQSFAIIANMAMLPPLIASLLPLIILPGLLFYFDVTPKVALLLLGVSAAVIPARLVLADLWQRRSGVWLTVLLAVQLASLVWSTAFSADPALSIGGGNWRRLGLLTHIALLLFTLISASYLSSDARRLRTWLAMFCAAGIGAAVYGCAQYAGIDPWLPSSAYHIGEGEWTIVRPPSTLGHASYAATFYLHVIFAGIALVLADWGAGRLRWLGMTAAALGSVALILSGTRGAILGWLAGLGLLALLRRPKLHRRHWAVAALVLAMGAIFYYSPPGQKLRSRTRWYAEDTRGGARLWLWRDSLRMGATHWLTGWGPEVFPREFPRFQSPELARAYPDFYNESPHNMFLDAWTSQGLLGAATLAALCAFTVGFRRRSPSDSAIWAGLVAAIVAQQFTSFTVATEMCFYLFVALLAAAGPPDRDGSVHQVHGLALAPVALMLAGYGVALAVSDRMIEIAKRELDAGRLAPASQAYERALLWQPLGVNADIWYSRKLLEAARRTPRILEGADAIRLAAEAAGRAAVHAEDRHNAYYNLATIQAVRNDLPQVESNLRKAIEVSPYWFKPHWTLAQVLSLAGRQAEAEREAGIAADLAGSRFPEVTRTWEQIRGKK
jgi:O-antigen ligase